MLQTVFPGREFPLAAFGHPGLEYDIEAATPACRSSARRGWLSDRVEAGLAGRAIGGGVEGLRALGVKPCYAIPDQDPSTRDKYLEASIFQFLPHEQLEVLNGRGACITLHVPKADRLGHPGNIAEIKQIRRQYPRVRLIIAHLGRCYTLPHAEEALPQLADEDGLYFDNSAVLNPDVHRLALRTLGASRILYGTDNPFLHATAGSGRKNVYQPDELPLLLQQGPRTAGGRGRVHALHV